MSRILFIIFVPINRDELIEVPLTTMKILPSTLAVLPTITNVEVLLTAPKQQMSTLAVSTN